MAHELTEERHEPEYRPPTPLYARLADASHYESGNGNGNGHHLRADHTLTSDPPAIERSDDPPTIEQPAVNVTYVEPAPTIGAALRQLLLVVGGHLRDLRPSLDRRSALRVIGQGVSVVGVLLLTLAAFEGVLGTLTEQRDQRELRGAFVKMLEAQGGFAPVTDGGARIIPSGTPVAEIAIPKIGLRKIVVEGTRSDDLRQGPGHLRSTPIPGQHGNSVIAGRRTTYGGPFGRLDELVADDPIEVTTPFGTFIYRVRDVESLPSGESDRLGATASDNLTLTTSDPPFRASKRLVVVARLDGEPSTYTDPLRQAQVPMEEGSFFGDASKWWVVLLTELLVVISLLVARALFNRWRRWPAYLVIVPILLATTFAWLEAMVALLPSTL